jgi:hypothetical protein
MTDKSDFTHAQARKLATAAACDAGNTSARRAGRSEWAPEDWAPACEMQLRVMGLLGHPTARNPQARVGLAMRRFRRVMWSMLRRPR